MTKCQVYFKFIAFCESIAIYCVLNIMDGIKERIVMEAETIKQIIELFDSIIKIGLGAIIGAVASYFAIKLNHKNSISKAKLDKKMEILDGLSLESEKYFSAYINYYSFFQNLKKAADTRMNITPLTLLKEYSDEHDKKENRYLEAINIAENIRAKLHLLGINEAEEFILNTDGIISELRNLILVEEKSFPVQEGFEEATLRLIEYKKKYYQMLKSYFDTLE